MDIKTISESVTSNLIVEKSKFISYLFPCDSKEKANEIITLLKEKYMDATHVCYAYIIIEDDVTIYKAFDDGEPSQTAGAPILNVLRKNGLCNIICVVIRYFGGIKLGAGGLTRTYSNSASEVVKLANIKTFTDAYYFDVTFPYEQTNKMDKLFENNRIDVINKRYDMQITYTILVYDVEKVSAILSRNSYLNISYVLKSKTKAIKK